MVERKFPYLWDIIQPKNTNVMTYTALSHKYDTLSSRISKETSYLLKNHFELTQHPEYAAELKQDLRELRQQLDDVAEALMMCDPNS